MGIRYKSLVDIALLVGIINSFEKNLPFVIDALNSISEASDSKKESAEILEVQETLLAVRKKLLDSEEFMSRVFTQYSKG